MRATEAAGELRRGAGPAPSVREARPRERRRPDPLAAVFGTEAVPILEASPGLRPVAVFEELMRRHPELSAGVRGTLEWGIRRWRALLRPEQEVNFRQTRGLGDLRPTAIRTSAPASPSAPTGGLARRRFLAALAEHEIAERARRRTERHLAKARLPLGKTLDAFDFDAVPMISKAQVMALVASNSGLEKGDQPPRRRAA